jgi:phosphoserine aminotransferase
MRWGVGAPTERTVLEGRDHVSALQPGGRIFVRTLRQRPGWTPKSSHLPCSTIASIGRRQAKLAEVIQLSRDVLGMPADHRLGIVPASDTGAVEMALWSLSASARRRCWRGKLRQRMGRRRRAGTEVTPMSSGPITASCPISTRSTGRMTWCRVERHHVRRMRSRWQWIPADREGLAICDATSAVFAMELPWNKLDVVTWSWQKVLGGEAAHGMIALSPRAVERLTTHRPSWPITKIFRMAKDGKLIEGIFKGDTINTPSLLCVEDQIDALKWALKIGGVPSLIARSRGNLAALEEWVGASKWAAFLAKDPKARSSTSVCLKIVDRDVAALPAADQAKFAGAIASLLEKEGVAFDIGSYRDAPPGLRIWCGGTIEQADIEALTLWLDWAFATIKNQIQG